MKNLHFTKNERNRQIGERIFNTYLKNKENQTDGTQVKQPVLNLSSTSQSIVQNQSDDSELGKLQNEIENLKSENFNIKAISALEKAGCLNSELASKVVPKDCENINDWVEKFKSDNEYMFKKTQPNHSTTFKPSQCRTLNTNEIMNNFIRGIF